jgi:hypothetical protein
MGRTRLSPRVVLLLKLVREVRVLDAEVGRALEALVAHVHVVRVHAPEGLVDVRGDHHHVLVPQAVCASRRQAE